MKIELCYVTESSCSWRCCLSSWSCRICYWLFYRRLVSGHCLLLLLILYISPSSQNACKDHSLYKCFEYLLTKLSSNINVLIIFRWSLTLAVFETIAENNTRNSTKLNSLLSIIHGTSYRQLNNRTVQLLTI